MMKKAQMIRPEQVVQAAARKERENERFRAFLKRKADPDVLDGQFLRLHREIFSHYDCTRCRNCCRLLFAQIPDDEIDRDAALLKMSRADFIAEYLQQDDFGAWAGHSPCGFLKEDGSCKLVDCRPDGCKNFPYTDQPGRLYSLYSVLNAVSVCPAAYEIFEALKKEYRFPSRRKGNLEECSDISGSGFSFIAGYTSWGFPYGTPEETDEEDQASSDDVPF